MSRYFECITKDPKITVSQPGIFGRVYLQSQDREIPDIFASQFVMVFHVSLSLWHDITNITKKISYLITLQ